MMMAIKKNLEDAFPLTFFEDQIDPITLALRMIQTWYISEKRKKSNANRLYSRRRPALWRRKHRGYLRVWGRLQVAHQTTE